MTKISLCKHLLKHVANIYDPKTKTDHPLVIDYLIDKGIGIEIVNIIYAAWTWLPTTYIAEDNELSTRNLLFAYLTDMQPQKLEIGM